jgi:nucleoside-diphosphate-sugar epimerase
MRRSNPAPKYSYALAKLLSEEMARQFNRRTGIPFVGLRLSNIIEPDGYAAHQTKPCDGDAAHPRETGRLPRM